MKSKYLKYLIIGIIIILIILIIVIIYMKNSVKYKSTPQTEDIPIVVTSSVERVSSRNEYYYVKRIIENFYLSCEEINNSEEIDKEVYAILDNEYISYDNITTENIKNKIKSVDNVLVDIDDMYVAQKDKNIYVYFVYGNLINKDTQQLEKFSIIVNVDRNNYTYKILLQDYLEEKYGTINIGDNLNLTEENEISNDIYNIFEYSNISDSEYISDIYNNYNNYLLYNVNGAYNYLNEEYKNGRFSSLEKFKAYVKKNYIKIIKMQLSKYKKTNYSEYTQYVCYDTNGEYYVFIETAPGEYTVMLDSYTIDLPEFIEKYNSSEDKTKVAMNIEKARQAINGEDYNYVYNKLDSTFKTNYFPTEESMEKYLIAQLFSSNTFTINDIDEQNGVYIFTITVTDTNNTSAESKSMNIVMKLQEGTDFVMSFSME